MRVSGERAELVPAEGQGRGGGFAEALRRARDRETAGGLSARRAASAVAGRERADRKPEAGSPPPALADTPLASVGCRAPAARTGARCAGAPGGAGGAIGAGPGGAGPQPALAPGLLPAGAGAATPPSSRALALAVRAVPPAIEALRAAGGREALALDFGRALGVEVRAVPGGVSLVLLAAPALLPAARAELPALLRTMEARGVAVRRAEARVRGAGEERGR